MEELTVCRQEGVKRLVRDASEFPGLPTGKLTGLKPDTTERLNTLEAWALKTWFSAFLWPWKMWFKVDPNTQKW